MELIIKDLCKSYGKKEVLKHLNATLKTGTYGLLGENGAGKSTFMRILATVDFQTAGEVTFDGQEIGKLDENYRDLLGYMPQDYNVFSSYTAHNFLEYMGALKGIEKNALTQKITEVLAFVNLSDVANKKVKNFSGGMKRRLGIAQAILNDPKILILDEPTAGLDPKERIRFSNIISTMSKDKIVILSTHIVSDIEAIANDLIIIKNGELMAFEGIDSLIGRVSGRVFEAVVGQDIYTKILDERKVVHVKQVQDLVKVRYVGEPYLGINNIALEPNLEDFYVAECL